MFRSKESSKRIELSRLVQDLLNFAAPCGSGEEAGGWGCLGAWGCPHTCSHACTHMYAHVYMYRNCKWLPTWRHPCLSCLHVYNMHAHACMHAWDNSNTSIPTATPIHPPATPQEGTPRISQNSITLELIKIIRFHLKF